MPSPIIKPKLTEEIVRTILYIYEYDKKCRRARGLQRATKGLRKNMADRVFFWHRIRVTPHAIKMIVARKRWKRVRVKINRTLLVPSTER